MEAAMDAVYNLPEYYWGRNPNNLAAQLTDLFAPGQVAGKRLIDLGCGEGRDAIHFAKQGFVVTALDISRPGLEKARRWAAEEGLSLRAVEGDIRTYRLDQEYDMVYASGVVQHFPHEARPAIFAHYKQMTAVGGLHAFNAFVEKPFIPPPPDYQPDEYFYRSGELMGYYWDWEIVSISEIIFNCNSSGVPHQHAMDVLIARRVV